MIRSNSRLVPDANLRGRSPRIHDPMTTVADVPLDDCRGTSARARTILAFFLYLLNPRDTEPRMVVWIDMIGPGRRIGTCLSE